MIRIILLALAAVFSLQGQDDKIDPQVSMAIRGGRSVPVLLLGQKQLLEGPQGFSDFCRKNSRSRRRELRAQLIVQLKKIAKAEQSVLREELNLPKETQGLWVVNAVAVTLTPEAILSAAKNKWVKYIYPAGPIPLGQGRGRVGTVLGKPAVRLFSTEGKTIPWNLKAVKADQVWSKLKITGQGSLVAMYDAGVDYTHEDLRENIWRNPGEMANNGKDDDGNGWVDDIYGFNFRLGSPDVKPNSPQAGRLQHGTLTSGIVAGDGTGGTITGVAPRAKLMPLIGWGGLYGAARVHEYALENGADVMNMSFSIPNLGHARGFWRLMSEQATAAGLVLVSGAGNFQRLLKPVQLRIPEGIPCVIAAGGVDRNLKVPDFVSLGPVEWEGVKFYEDHPMPKGLIKPDVSAFPGPNYPVLANKRGYLDPNNRVKGNSFSGPHVAGTVALMFSANPELTAWRVKEILEISATDLGVKGKDNDTGAGLLNALAAVKAAMAEIE